MAVQKLYMDVKQHTCTMVSQKLYKIFCVGPGVQAQLKQSFINLNWFEDI